MCLDRCKEIPSSQHPQQPLSRVGARWLLGQQCSAQRCKTPLQHYKPRSQAMHPTPMAGNAVHGALPCSPCPHALTAAEVRVWAARGPAELMSDLRFALISRLETQSEEQTLPFPVPLERLQLRRMSPFSSTLNLQPSFPGRSYFELRSSAHQLSLHSSLQSLNSAGEPSTSGISLGLCFWASPKSLFVLLRSVCFSHDMRMAGGSCAVCQCGTEGILVA